ncbi:MAG: hypothetical protein ACE5E7_07945 [Anaerolineae bacterium]
MGITRRIGRITRLIDVPLCAGCRRELNRLSGEEERLLLLGRLTAAVLAVLVLAIVLLLTPVAMSLTLRFLAAFTAALAAAVGILRLFRRARQRAALPTKQAIRRSARLASFSWRAATFEFENETFAERFMELNKPLLMET